MTDVISTILGGINGQFLNGDKEPIIEYAVFTFVLRGRILTIL